MRLRGDAGNACFRVVREGLFGCHAGLTDTHTHTPPVSLSPQHLPTELLPLSRQEGEANQKPIKTFDQTRHRRLPVFVTHQHAGRCPLAGASCGRASCLASHLALTVAPANRRHRRLAPRRAGVSREEGQPRTEAKHSPAGAKHTSGTVHTHTV